MVISHSSSGRNLTPPYMLNISGSVAVLKETLCRAVLVNHIIILAPAVSYEKIPQDATEFYDKNCVTNIPVLGLF